MIKLLKVIKVEEGILHNQLLPVRAAQTYQRTLEARATQQALPKTVLAGRGFSCGLFYYVLHFFAESTFTNRKSLQKLAQAREQLACICRAFSTPEPLIAYNKRFYPAAVYTHFLTFF